MVVKIAQIIVTANDGDLHGGQQARRDSLILDWATQIVRGFYPDEPEPVRVRVQLTHTQNADPEHPIVSAQIVKYTTHGLNPKVGIPTVLDPGGKGPSAPTPLELCLQRQIARIYASVRAQDWKVRLPGLPS